jgi:hypothetical protein
MKSIFLFCFVLFACYSGVKAQGLSQARSEFDRFEFVNCVKIYQAVLESESLKKKDLERLSYASYMSSDWEYCLKIVEKLDSIGDIEPMYLLMKADALKHFNRFEEAKIAYSRYATAAPEDNVSIDMASCDYLPTLKPAENISVNRLDFNTKKADACFVDAELGMIVFHELGIDSVYAALNLEASNNAELLLMRPFLKSENGLVMIEFPEKMKYLSITSLSKSQVSDWVVFTVVDLTNPDFLLTSPQLFVGKYASNKVTNVSPWKFSNLKNGVVTANGVFAPQSNAVVFACINDTSKMTDLYISKFEEDDWLLPAVLAGINTAGEDVYPQFFGNDFYFASTGRLGYGALDVYAGILDVNNASVSDIRHFSEPINSSFDDFWYVNFMDTLFISSNRFGSGGEDDIWELMPITKEDEIVQTGEVIECFKTEIHDWVPPKIYFILAKDIPNSDYSFLNKVARILSDNQELRINVLGHTDVRGSKTANQKLSEQRAAFVKKELIKLGIPERQIISTGLGETLAQENSRDNSSQKAHQENRFVSIVLELNK